MFARPLLGGGFSVFITGMSMLVAILGVESATSASIMKAAYVWFPVGWWVQFMGYVGAAMIVSGGVAWIAETGEKRRHALSREGTGGQA